MVKPFDVRLDLGHDGVRNFALELTAADWLANGRGLAKLRFCHQLDAATSGLLLAAKDKAAAAAAGRLFELRRARKQYLALVFGHVPAGTHALVDAPIGPVEGSAFLQAPLPLTEGGKAAQTAVRVLKHGTLALRGLHHSKPASLLLLEPKSGRRHQLRVHCQGIGHPIVGDGTYAKDWDSYRLFLHARRLRLSPLPVAAGELDAVAECVDFDEALDGAVDVEPLPTAAEGGDGWIPTPGS
ncbi:pseudouridine synthase [Pavlovales sp. CCMP2436]|nr:pseudouridine synthase [Pavlovales sp. CCMP2436]|mmetsp:Transcript_3597/g.9038  ORF Transcript_3597/g.9038 Transcript_3597/m.9038 type:complete len:241 (+) Transcript_3597:470-1192(+)